MLVSMPDQVFIRAEEIVTIGKGTRRQINLFSREIEVRIVFDFLAKTTNGEDLSGSDKPAL